MIHICCLDYLSTSHRVIVVEPNLSPSLQLSHIHHRPEAEFLNVINVVDSIIIRLQFTFLVRGSVNFYAGL